jgi:hypothetical protein
MGVMPHDHPVIPLAIPLAGTNSHDVRNRSLGSELEVVRGNWIHPLPGLARHVEQPEKGD